MLGFGNSATGNLEIVARYRGDEAATKVRQLGTDVRGVGNAGKEAAGGLNQAEAATGKFAAGARGLQSVLGGLFAGYLGIQGIRLLKDFTTGVYESRLALEAASGVVSRQMIPLGIDYTRVIGDMRKATLGLVDDVTLLQNSGRAMMAFTASGISTAKSYEVLTTAMEFATLASRAFGLEATESINRIVTGLSRGSPQLLDDFGIIIDLQDETFRSLHGTEQKVAVLNAALGQMNTFIAANRSELEKLVPWYERWATAMKNIASNPNPFSDPESVASLVASGGASQPRPRGPSPIITRGVHGPSVEEMMDPGQLADYIDRQIQQELVFRRSIARPDTWQTAFPDLSADATMHGVNAPQQWGGLGESEWILRNVGVEVGQVISQAAVSVIREEIGLLPTIDTSDIIARASQPSYGQRFETSFASGFAAPFSPEALGWRAASLGLGQVTRGVSEFVDSLGIFGTSAEKQLEAAKMQLRAAEAIERQRTISSSNVAYWRFRGDNEKAGVAEFNASTAAWHEQIFPTLGGDTGALPNDVREEQRKLYEMIQRGDTEAARAYILKEIGGPKGLRGLFTEGQIDEGTVGDFFNAFMALESSLEANTDAINAQTQQMQQDLFDAEFRALTSNMLTGARSPEQIRSIVQQRSAEYSMLDPYAAGVYGGGTQTVDVTVTVNNSTDNGVEVTVQNATEDGRLHVTPRGTATTTTGSSGYTVGGGNNRTPTGWYDKYRPTQARF